MFFNICAHIACIHLAEELKCDIELEGGGKMNVLWLQIGKYYKVWISTTPFSIKLALITELVPFRIEQQ